MTTQAIILLSVLISVDAPTVAPATPPPPSTSSSTSEVGKPSQKLQSAVPQNAALQQRVPGSEILASTYPIEPGSATASLVQGIVALEKVIGGPQTATKEEVKKKEAEIKALVSHILDLDSMGKGAMATYWDEFGKKKAGVSVKDRDRYMKLFKRLVEENYLEKAREYVGRKYQITLVSEATGLGGKTLVTGRIKKSDVDVIIEFQMQKNGSEWKVKDLKLDETSLEATYRSSFNRIIKKKGGIKAGLPELLSVMDKRLAEIQKGKATTL